MTSNSKKGPNFLTNLVLAALTVVSVGCAQSQSTESSDVPQETPTEQVEPTRTPEPTVNIDGDLYTIERTANGYNLYSDPLSRKGWFFYVRDTDQNGKIDFAQGQFDGVIVECVECTGVYEGMERKCNTSYPEIEHHPDTNSIFDKKGRILGRTEYYDKVLETAEDAMKRYEQEREPKMELSNCHQRLHPELYGTSGVPRIAPRDL